METAFTTSANIARNPGEDDREGCFEAHLLAFGGGVGTNDSRGCAWSFLESPSAALPEKTPRRPRDDLLETR